MAGFFDDLFSEGNVDSNAILFPFIFFIFIFFIIIFFLFFKGWFILG